jgi:hypothetical protein
VHSWRLPSLFRTAIDFLGATIPEDFKKCYFKFPNPPDEIKLQVLFEPFASGEESG